MKILCDAIRHDRMTDHYHLHMKLQLEADPNVENSPPFIDPPKGFENMWFATSERHVQEVHSEMTPVERASIYLKNETAVIHTFPKVFLPMKTKNPRYNDTYYARNVHDLNIAVFREDMERDIAEGVNKAFSKEHGFNSSYLLMTMFVNATAVDAPWMDKTPRKKPAIVDEDDEEGNMFDEEDDEMETQKEITKEEELEGLKKKLHDEYFVFWPHSHPYHYNHREADPTKMGAICQTFKKYRESNERFIENDASCPKLSLCEVISGQEYASLEAMDDERIKSKFPKGEEIPVLQISHQMDTCRQMESFGGGIRFMPATLPSLLKLFKILTGEELSTWMADLPKAKTTWEMFKYAQDKDASDYFPPKAVDLAPLDYNYNHVR